ncbi:MAG: HEAT repeat domain-containing protein [Deltaproteobacteria bacterium]|nr:HEAT repeat domain-containing protein [Deltaproteobacteria bacterium]
MGDELKKMIVDALILSMKDGDSRLRCYAVKALGVMKAKEAVEPLRGFLNDPDPDVRCNVVTALGETGDKRVVPSLIPLLEDEDPFVRVSAIQAIENIGDPLAVEPLIQAMTSTPSFPAFLGELSCDYGWEVRERAISALGGMKDTRVVQALTDFLKDGDADMWQGAIFKSLVQLGDRKGIEVVAGYLKNPDTAVRRRASGTFLYAQDPSVVDHLKRVLTDEDGLVKVNLIKAMGRLGNENDMASLIPLLKDKDNDVRLKAMEVIARRGGRKAVEYILPLLHDPTSSIRRKVAELLGSVGDKDCVEPLIDTLKKDVCGEAILSLGKIGDEGAVKPIIAILKDRKRVKDLRAKATFALGELKTIEGLQAILNIASDKGEDHHLRGIAIQSLPWFDEKVVIEGITPLLKDGDNLFKIGFSRILRDFKDQETDDLLLHLLRDEDPEVKKESAIALAYRGKEIGLVILSPLINPPCEGGRRGEEGEDFSPICDAIKNIKSERAKELLTEGLKGEDPSLRWASLRAIGQIGDKGLAGPVIGLLADSSREVRREAVVALGRLGYKGALRPLVTALFDYEGFGNLRQEVATALKAIDQEEAIALLLERLMDRGVKANHWVAIEALSIVC